VPCGDAVAHLDASSGDAVAHLDVPCGDAVAHLDVPCGDAVAGLSCLSSMEGWVAGARRFGSAANGMPNGSGSEALARPPARSPRRE